MKLNVGRWQQSVLQLIIFRLPVPKYVTRINCDYHIDADSLVKCLGCFLNIIFFCKQTDIAITIYDIACWNYYKIIKTHLKYIRDKYLTSEGTQADVLRNCKQLIEAEWRICVKKKTRLSWVHIMACGLFCAKPLSEPLLAHYKLGQVSVNQTTITVTDENESMPIEPSGTNVSEIWIKIQQFAFKRTTLKTSSAKWRPFC